MMSMGGGHEVAHKSVEELVYGSALKAFRRLHFIPDDEVWNHIWPLLRKAGIFRSADLLNVLSGKGFEFFAALEIESAQSARRA
jgi:hypothetical protein